MIAGLLTGALAALEVEVSAATIRKWVQQGHLRPAGRRGRAQLFRLEDVFAAERLTRRGHERGGAGGVVRG
ncbi:helix-turn-helix domain-containing protein [Streptomyces sp. NPDC002055]|uniref:helix-turn-helix domain-containing protein n=1 Tax=Streptomyces sp. NPDC002055 TaxID=3154534 RepID=UPI00331A9EA6